jgi:serine/threonine protein kinase/alpha-tubulin suppressor-like RCC1 family protein
MNSVFDLVGGRYRIISTLGEGGMGTAYRAWDTEAGTPVVIKMPKDQFRTNPDFMERFAREIKTMEALKHPHIVAIDNYELVFGDPFVAMRFLPGGSLAHRRPRDAAGKPLPVHPSSLFSWLPAIASALDFAHSHGVVHRDVKPDNIFFDAFSTAYLGDFGIAKVVADSELMQKEETLTGTNIAVGTQAYMAPELFAPKATIDGTVDQYALGVMVYEQLSGSRPFNGESAHIAVEHCTLPPPPLQKQRPGLPQHLCDAVHQALEKRNTHRFSSCSEFAAAVLKGVPRPPKEEGIARLLCPGCPKILKLKDSSRGKIGACPQCKCTLHIANDLASLWIDGEEVGERSPRTATSPVPSQFSTVSTTARPSGFRWAFVAAGVLAAIVVVATWWQTKGLFGVAANVSEKRNVKPIAAGSMAENRNSDGGHPEAKAAQSVHQPDHLETDGVKPRQTPARVRSIVFVQCEPANKANASAEDAGHTVKNLLETNQTDEMPIFIPAAAETRRRGPSEMKNRAAFAALKQDGSVVTWGDAQCGGDSSRVADQLASGVIRVYSTSRAFAAVKSDGSVVAWGHPSQGGSLGDQQPSLQSGVARLISTQQAFAAIKADGVVKVWGTPEWVDQENRRCYRVNTSTTYYRPRGGYDHEPRKGGSAESFSWSDDLDRHNQLGDRLFAGRYFFSCDPRLYATRIGNGTSDPTDIQKHPLEATQVVATDGAIAVLSPSGSVETWGNPRYGGDSSRFAGLLAADVVHVSATRSAFAVLRADGSVFAFGNPHEGGNTEPVAARIRSDVFQLTSTLKAFAAIKSDGCVLTWGDARCGGDSSSLPSTLTADGRLTQNIVSLYANSEAFAAITAEGAAVAWGAFGSGGDTASVSSHITSGVVSMAATETAFAALKEDGSVVSWGNRAAGGDQSPVAKQLRSGVIFIVSTDSAFAALKSDGSVVAWGNQQTGGEIGTAAAALRENVVSLATPFVDERAVQNAGCGLLITVNHADPEGGSWQYSLDGRNWADVPLEIRPTAPLVLRSEARLRYRCTTTETVCSRHLSAAVLPPHQGSFDVGGRLTLTPRTRPAAITHSFIDSAEAEP